MPKIILNPSGLWLPELSATPGNPSSGAGAIYAKTDGKVYFLNDAGTEYDLTGGGGASKSFGYFIA